MKWVFFAIMCFVVGSKFAHAGEEVRIYQVNKYGQTQYQKGYIKIKDNKAQTVNKYGQTQYQKPSLVIKKK
jgi:hypothetical protein